MGTRGTIKIIANKKRFTTYNHWNSQPKWLGNMLVEKLLLLIQKYGLEQVKVAFGNMRLVTRKDKPTLKDAKDLEKYTNLHVSSQSTNDWYCLLRETQGNLEAMYDAGVILMEEDEDAIEEYNYTINFDDQTFHVDSDNNVLKFEELKPNMF